MADICTLIVVTTMTTQACFTPPACASMPRNDGKILCTPSLSTACPIPAPTYECKREDGSIYIWQDVHGSAY